MQAFYSGNINTSKTKLRMSNFNSSDRDTFERREKRSPYRNAGISGNNEPAGDRGGNDLLFMLLTIILLLILWPVGIVMLWTRKFRLGWAGKLLITLITAVIFCFALAFAANIPTKNPTVQKVQNVLNDGFDWVYGKTGGTIDEAGNLLTQIFDDGSSKLAVIWDEIDESVAAKYLELYACVRPNIKAVSHDIPALLGGKYLEVTGYETPVPEKIEKQTGEDKGVKVAEPTATPTATPAPKATPTPTPTPKPTPTATPIMVPTIKNVALAPVYYTARGTYYHRTKNCSGMVNADSHTLQEAQIAGKKVCENCDVVNIAMLDYDGNYLWIDSKNIAHTTDECMEFPADGRYSVKPFEDVYQGHYTYCPVCRADVCYEYMLANDSRFNTSYEDLDEATKVLYDYEKTITVYYGENSRKYHANQECQYMYDAKYVHTLYEALHVDVKDRCGICSALSEEEAIKQFSEISAQ